MTAEAPASPLLLTALLFGPLVAGLATHAALEPPARAWHQALRKSPYRPPAFVFPVAWVWSYLAMGYASALVRERAARGPALPALAAAYLAHHALLLAWAPLCFVARRLDWALAALVALDALVAALLAAAAALAPLAAVLCLPYWCWLLELTYLNAYMLRHNDRALVGWAAQTKEQVVAAHAAPAAPAVDARADKTA